MEPVQHNEPEPRLRGILARPLDALVFLLPLILFYELASIADPDRVIAFALLRSFVELFGRAGSWAPGLLVIVVLLATHLASREPWKVHWRTVGLMYVEAVVLAGPLLLLNWATMLSSAQTGGSPLIDGIALAIGAGIYEELVFRLILISLLVVIGVDLLGRRAGPTALAAIAISSLLFAAHHHRPMGIESFDLTRFAFRTMAGIYLAAVFWFRGYGPAAGCHAAHNVVLVVAGVLPLDEP